MDDKIKELRTLAIVPILQKLASGMKMQEALEGTEVSERSFYRVIDTHPELIDEVIEQQSEVIRQNYLVVTAAHQKAISRIARLADIDLSTFELLSIEKRLAELRGTMEKYLKADSRITSPATQYLSGLNLRPGKTRITRTETTIEIDSDKPTEVIDLSAKQE